MKTNFNWIILFSFLFAVLGFKEVKQDIAAEIDLVGTWFYTYGNSYMKSTNQGADARWYSFKKNGKVEFSTCTDWCGCMRKTYQGDWQWETDGIIAVTYTKYKRRGTGFGKLDQTRSERLNIRSSGKNKLEIIRVYENN